MTYTQPQTPFETVYNIVLACGRAHNQKDFCINILHAFLTNFPFDQARVYFLNDSGNIYDQYLMGIDEYWGTAYYEYYSKLLNSRYHHYENLHNDLRPLRQKISVKSKEEIQAERNKFYQEYPFARPVESSVGFSLFDEEDDAKTVFMFDRYSFDFSDYEQRIIQLAYPQLNNLHKNFFSKSNTEIQLEQVNWDTTNLTPREVDVTMLLCQGVSPSNISKKLGIAQSTIYKHISHIYSKMQVSTRQELLVRILNR